MCQIYASTDPVRYESQTLSIRLQGMVTSVRLENEFWRTLEEIAEGEGCSVPQFINRLYKEVVELRGEVSNLASLLRVVCVVYRAERPRHYERVGSHKYEDSLVMRAIEGSS